jgi:hypothetical protein
VRAAWVTYERAATLWQALVFCHRCDGVFVPGEQRPLVPSARPHDFLHGAVR